MATDTQIRQRQAVALNRVLDAAGRLADRLPDVDAPEIPTRLRYPEMLPLMQLEAIAGFLDAVEAAVAAQDAPKPANRGGDTPKAGTDADGGTATPDAAPTPRKGKAS